MGRARCCLAQPLRAPAQHWVGKIRPAPRGAEGPQRFCRASLGSPVRPMPLEAGPWAPVTGHLGWRPSSLRPPLPPAPPRPSSFSRSHLQCLSRLLLTSVLLDCLPPCLPCLLLAHLSPRTQAARGGGQRTAGPTGRLLALSHAATRVTPPSKGGAEPRGLRLWGEGLAGSWAAPLKRES